MAEPTHPLVVVVDDDARQVQLLCDHLRGVGIRAHPAVGGAAGLAAVRSLQPDVLLTDLSMPDLSGYDLLRSVLDEDPTLPVIILTGAGGPQAALEAIRLGAFHYLSKPPSLAELEVFVRRGLERRRLREENRRLRASVGASVDGVVGRSAVMHDLGERVRRVARSRVPVLIRGESGTGKELVARAVHALSPRASQPFVAVNCTALPASLLESELFGHVRGAYTGAAGPRRGLFVEADGGTLFLDEIGDMPTDLQARLLRVLQEGAIRPVGADRERPVDVRVLTATHQDLERAVAENRFRADLLYRLNVVALHIPPLRDRIEDIPLLVDHFLEQAKRENPESVVESFSGRLLAALARRPWPGNVRELQNAVRRIVVLCADIEAGPDELELVAPPTATPGPLSRPDPPRLDAALPTLRQVEDAHIRRVMESVQGNKAAAARVLDIERKTLYRRLEQLGEG